MKEIGINILMILNGNMTNPMRGAMQMLSRIESGCGADNPTNGGSNKKYIKIFF
jgi:hypothetical protein